MSATAIASHPIGHDRSTLQGLSWVDRAICAYLVIPLLLFCLLFKLPIAIALLALTAFGCYQAIGRNQPTAIGLSPAWWFAIVALALAWTALSGVGHLFYANTDWIIRDATLHDLTQAGVLPAYQPQNGAPLLLRAPIGYYLPAATLGHAFGQGASQFGLFVWTALGVVLFLAATCSLFQTHVQRVLCLLVIVLFSGMDLLGVLWKIRTLPPLGENIEWWMNIIQYPSNAYLLAWVPNHALPAWLATLLIVKHWKRQELASVTPLLAASVPLWSPLAAIGLFPFFLFGLRWVRDFRTLFSLRSCLPFLPPALAAAAYLTMSSATIKHGWFISAYPSTGAFIYSYVLFVLLEFGMLALILLRLTRANAKLLIAITMLCLLPMYVYGPYNDVAMRSSIPALLVLALATIKPLADFRATSWHLLLVAVLMTGSVTAFQELIRATIGPPWSYLNQSLPDAVVTEHSWSDSRYPTHYLSLYDDHDITRWMRPPVLIYRDQSTTSNH